jgi:hypothetical protein
MIPDTFCEKQVHHDSDKKVGDSQVESTHPSSIRVFLQFSTLPAESSASCSENSKDIAASKQAGLLSVIIKDNQTDNLFCLCEEIQFYKSYIDQRAKPVEFASKMSSGAWGLGGELRANHAMTASVLKIPRNLLRF